MDGNSLVCSCFAWAASGDEIVTIVAWLVANGVAVAVEPTDAVSCETSVCTAGWVEALAGRIGNPVTGTCVI